MRLVLIIHIVMLVDALHVRPAVTALVVIQAAIDLRGKPDALINIGL
jgi:hypothetical protein